MAPKPDLSGYKYSNMSSLVTHADPRDSHGTSDEPTGEVQSLVGRIDPKLMGDKAYRERAKPDVDQPAPKRARTTNADVSLSDADAEGLAYVPKTSETRHTYQLFLTCIHSILTEEPDDLIRSAADAVIQILRDSSLNEASKQRQTRALLGSVEVSDNTYRQLATLANQLLDYRAPSSEAQNNAQDADENVAVVFDEDEDEEDVEEDESESDHSPASPEEPEPRDIDQDTVQISAQEGTSATIHARDVDAHFLQRYLTQVFPDALTASSKTDEVLSILQDDSLSLGAMENALMDIFDYDHFEHVSTIVTNRGALRWGTVYSRSPDEAKEGVLSDMASRGLSPIVHDILGHVPETPETGADSRPMHVDRPLSVDSLETLDLESLAFSQGARLMTNTKTTLPQGSVRRKSPKWEEIAVPPLNRDPAQNSRSKVVIRERMPEWTHAAFPHTQELNPVQSVVFPAAFQSDEPLLVCAPTGAGKTNIAMLTILRLISQYMDDDNRLDVSQFKLVYIAPMKALVQEMVGNFSKRLEPFGLRVAELTGDSQLTKDQLASTQMIITTPEKWDIVTRKATDTSYTNLVKLVIIDEIHLLHDDRGPVLECIVARTKRTMDLVKDPVRLVGLSATLPNFKDVAQFLDVAPDRGMFRFDASFRPVPLQQEIVGITEKRVFSRHQAANEACYEKVASYAGKEQVIVFVHSRKETAKTARFIRDTAIENETITQFVSGSIATQEILREESRNAKDTQLADLLPFGFAIHHAGLTREDRTLAEDLFAQGHIQVLVSTATLAWGVNLPAHAVIIKGTQIYNPAKGEWVELSPQDVLQMLGRAGRPQFDTLGEGFIITNHSEMQYYASMLTEQLPIESQLVKALPDHMNAEIVNGSIRTRDDAVAWMKQTYYYVRMSSHPALYGFLPDVNPDIHISNLVHTAALALEEALLIKYDKVSGLLVPNDLAKIAAHYYITHSSMKFYHQQCRSATSFIELFRILSHSAEFSLIPVRPEEKVELSKLLERVPVPVKESLDEPAAKINVLLQSYISQLSLDGFALLSDMVYVTQSAGRLFRALFELCLRRGYAFLAKLALQCCQMVTYRLWPTMSPLRQFLPSQQASSDLVRRVERKEFPWFRYIDLRPEELTELLGGDAKLAARVYRLVHWVPRLELEASIQPLTRSLIRVELTLTPDFQWNRAVHHESLLFHVIVEDVNGQVILFYDTFLLRHKYMPRAGDDSDLGAHKLSFTLPLQDPLAPNYFIRVLSDTWVGAETVLPLSLTQLILPDKFVPPRPLLDLQPSSFDSGNDAVNVLFPPQLNKILTQALQSVQGTDDSSLVFSPPNSNKFLLAEIALLRLWDNHPGTKSLVLEPDFLVDQRFDYCQSRLGSVTDKLFIKLSGDLNPDLEAIHKADVIISSPRHWDQISRRWRKRIALFNSIGLVIVNHLEFLGHYDVTIGSTLEVVLSRMRLISSTRSDGSAPIRFLGLAIPLANSKDIADWLGCPYQAVHNLSPAARLVPLQVQLVTFNVPHFPSLLIQMARPAFYHMRPVIQKGMRSLAWVASATQCRLSLQDLLVYFAAAFPARTEIVSGIDQSHLDEYPELAESLPYGLAFVHDGMSRALRKTIETLFQKNIVTCLLAPADMAYSLMVTCHQVLLLNMQSYDGLEHRYVDYPMAYVSEMLGRACISDTSNDKSVCHAVLLLPQVKRELVKKFLADPLPIESHLNLVVEDHFNAEVAVQTIENKQEAIDWLTWTWFYRRLPANPSYYGMQQKSQDALAEYLSELVESSISELENAKAVAVQDDFLVSPLNLGLIAAYYYVSVETISTFSTSLNEKVRIRGLIDVLSAASEFISLVPVRHKESSILSKIVELVPFKGSLDSTVRGKVHVLIQAHLSRLTLPQDLARDQHAILSVLLQLIYAAVDVMSSNGLLSSTIQAMELSQMVVQAVWAGPDAQLRQIPFFSKALVAEAQKSHVESVYDILDLDDEDRNKLLSMPAVNLRHVAAFCNSYPAIEVAYTLPGNRAYAESDVIPLQVRLTRDVDEDEDVSQTVVAQHFPFAKNESWWIVLGDPASGTLLGIKKIAVDRELTSTLSFSCDAGHHDLKLYLICDSYLGADQEFDVSLDVNEDSDESDSGMSQD